LPDYAAVDLGAESGRVVRGRFDGERIELDVVHRFANRPVRLPDGLRWNLLALFTETLEGLSRAAQAGALDGVGVDAWGVDYALLDGDRRVLGLPFHYRDGRTDGMIARAHARVPRQDLYAVTGIQTMPINTVFQLLADEGIPYEVRSLDRSELYIADEMFLCGTGVQVSPVIEIDHRTIGSGQPGPITRAIKDRYFDAVRGRLPQYEHWLTPIPRRA
jgi:hypothetical protein